MIVLISLILHIDTNNKNMLQDLYIDYFKLKPHE
jgi:hypothetical protein